MLLVIFIQSFKANFMVYSNAKAEIHIFIEDYRF